MRVIPSAGVAGRFLTEEDTIDGRLFSHLADDSGFQAVRELATPKASAPVKACRTRVPINDPASAAQQSGSSESRPH